MATETNNSESPNETLAPTTLDASPPAYGNLATAGEAINGDPKAKELQSERNEPANDIEKKIRRSERFGLPLQLSEQEKRNSRAERFGTVSGLGALNQSEELKRKSRAERFGLESKSAVDNEKKKARLARFGSNTKIDSQEEEKRKSRALRFAQSPADSQTYTKCKGTIELVTQEIAVTGSATGGT